MSDFCKYHGAGNDFILVDNRLQTFNIDSKYISHLCHRRFGIGADGLMLIENSCDSDFRMRFFNADGNEANMCGNGARCIVAFAHRLGIFKDKTKFTSGAGTHFAEIISKAENTIFLKVKITDVTKIIRNDDHYFIDTGVPHAVIFVDDIDKTDVIKEGKKWRYDSRFPEGTNVNFVQIIGDGEFKIATYERGVEDETLACGTGATASAIAIFDKFKNNISEYKIFAKGGTLGVSFNADNKNLFTNIWLHGPATFVFEGKFD